MREKQKLVEEKDQLHHKIFDAITCNLWHKKVDQIDLEPGDDKHVRIFEKKSKGDTEAFK